MALASRLISPLPLNSTPFLRDEESSSVDLISRIFSSPFGIIFAGGASVARKVKTQGPTLYQTFNWTLRKPSKNAKRRVYKFNETRLCAPPPPCETPVIFNLTQGPRNLSPVRETLVKSSDRKERGR